MRAALIDYRNGKNEDAFNLLKKNIDKFLKDSEALMTIAQIGASIKKDTSEVLEYAYQARRLGMNNPNIHIAYVGLFLGIDDSFDKSLNLEKVGVDSSVCVKTDGESNKWYTILNDGPVDKGRGEILITDPLAKKMIGLKKDDTVPIRDGFYEKLEFTVVEIRSKYVNSLRETLREFSSLFPENLSIQMMKNEDGDPTKAVALSARRNQIVRQVSEFYTRENLTIGQFSKLVGINQIQAWFGLGFNSGIVKVSAGTYEEQEEYAINVRGAKDVTLELTALLTLTNIKKLDLLSIRFENIYIAQTVLDVVIEEINAKQNFMTDHFSIEHNQDYMAIRETKKEQVQRDVDLLLGIKTFVQEKCKIVPVKLALKLGKEKYESLKDVLSPPSIDSVLVASETNTLLYTDDMILRGFAKIEFAVNGAWTQPILQDCVEKGQLSKDSYHELVAALIFANYNFVSVKAETLMFYLEKNNWNIVGETVRLFQVLAGPNTSIESAMQIVTTCIKEVWSKSLMLHQKIDILNLTLGSLVENRMSIPTIRLFINSVRKLYRNSFTPWYADEIIAHTNSWLHAHLSINQKNLLF